MTNLTSDSDILQTATPIRFVGGKYKTQQGWIDPTRRSNGRSTPVIVNVPSKGGLYQTSVHNGNYRELTTDHPMSYAEAVFLVPDVEASIVEAARKIAKFDISKEENGVEGFKEQFGKELKHAQKWQEDKKDKAVWRRVTEWEAQEVHRA